MQNTGDGQTARLGPHASLVAAGMFVHDIVVAVPTQAFLVGFGHCDVALEYRDDGGATGKNPTMTAKRHTVDYCTETDPTDQPRFAGRAEL